MTIPPVLPSMPPVPDELLDLDVTCRCRQCDLRRRWRLASAIAAIGADYERREAEEWEELRREAERHVAETERPRKVG